MTAKIIPLKPAEPDMTLDQILDALGIDYDPLPRQGDVDHVANYRAKRAALNRAAFRVV